MLRHAGSLVPSPGWSAGVCGYGPGMRAAAVFDLDRTLLPGASGELVTEALREAGLLDRRRPATATVERLVHVGFRHFGETLPAVALARAGARAARGRSREAVRSVAAATAPLLEASLQPWARALIDRHRRAGHVLVLATSMPHDLVDPLAERLGFDAVVATRFRTDDAGDYDGALDGEFTWATGKARAVRRWAEEHDVDLAASWAFSDSLYDVPLLSAVGHPHAVNPDPRLAVVAAARGWPVLHLDVPPGVPKVVGVEPVGVAAALLRLGLAPWARFEVEGGEHLADVGGAVVAGALDGPAELAAAGAAVARHGRSLRAAVVPGALDRPALGPAWRALGAVPLGDGSGAWPEGATTTDGDVDGDDPLAAVRLALRAGELVALMGPAASRVPEAALLATATSTAVVPVAVHLGRAADGRRPLAVRVQLAAPVAASGLTAPAAARRVRAALDGLDATRARPL